MPAKKKPQPPASVNGAQPELPPGVTQLRTLAGHKAAVYSVALDPRGGTLASGSGDNTVKLWDMRSGKLFRTLEEHKGWVWSVALDPEGGTLASGSVDSTVKLWEARSGKLLRTLEGHQSTVNGVAFDPQGEMLATGSHDNTVKLWEARSGNLLLTLERHTAPVHSIAISRAGHLLASKGRAKTVLWNCETWETVAVIPEPTNKDWWIPGVAFHPTLPLLAAVGSGPDTRDKERSRLIRLLELDFDVLLGRPRAAAADASTQHGTAKVIIVGDTGVGKSGLARRLKHGKFDLLAVPTDADESVARDMEQDARARRRRALTHWVVEGKKAEGKFDVLLSYNSKDRSEVKKIAEELKAVGLRPWVDYECLVPGRRWIRDLEEVIADIPCAAAFVGADGVGPWEEVEIEGMLIEMVERDAAVMPVLLPGAPDRPKLPPFLKAMGRVDMRDWETDENEGLERLVSGVLGRPLVELRMLGR